jgi:hypothetical protein
MDASFVKNVANGLANPARLQAEGRRIFLESIEDSIFAAGAKLRSNESRSGRHHSL